MGERRHAASLFSHSLKTPLSSVKVASQLLLKHLQGTLNEKDQQLLEMILRNGSILEARINKLIQLSTIGSDYLRMELSLAQLELVHSLREEAAAASHLEPPGAAPAPEAEST